MNKSEQITWSNNFITSYIDSCIDSVITKNISEASYFPDFEDSLYSLTDAVLKLSDNRYAAVKNSEIFIPIIIFKGKSCGNALINYLKSKGLTYSEIARILNRDPRTIWTIFQRSKRKNYLINTEKDVISEILVPISIFSYRGLSILESLVFWLKSEKGFDYAQIARLLSKNYQTIRTVYNRAINKIGEKKDV
ncbi:MAG: hypothetical protein KatS3mg002_1228 [Candidatus Woesearchaeota archaeon]|nr:MAG: hypothetical protein KatS3mg002_1228 [Candidatus Woesearchaeota archaeon]